MPIRLSDFVFETGAATTDASGEATITLSCFKSAEVPCVILSGFGATGNANANITDLFLVGSTWTAKIITSAPNITVHYRAINATAGDADSPSLVGQDLIYILTQNNEQIQVQTS